MSTPSRLLVHLLRATVVAGLCAAGPAGAATPAPAKAPAKAPAAAKSKAPAKPVEAPVAEANAEQIDAAERVYYGVYDCEFNQTVAIEKSAKHTSYVDVKNGKATWLMKPVLSSTGAIRLEDVKGETLMVQISSKSMLLNVKTARRIVDDCISPKQRELIAAAKQAKEAEAAAAAGGIVASTSTAATGSNAAAMPSASATSAPSMGTAPSTGAPSAPAAVVANDAAASGAASAPK